jgi:hypothetical protein
MLPPGGRSRQGGSCPARLRPHGAARAGAARVSGTPMSLLRLPWVASAASPCQARRMDAIICVTVVLPLLPVTLQSAANLNCAAPAHRRAGRAPCACICHDLNTRGKPASVRRMAAGAPATAATAPCASRVGQEIIGIKALTACKRHEQVAGLHACGCRCARAAIAGIASAVAAPTVHRAADCSQAWVDNGRIGMFTARLQSRPLTQRQTHRVPGRKTAGASGHRFPGSPHVPCRRSAPHRSAAACARVCGNGQRAVGLHGDTSHWWWLRPSRIWLNDGPRAFRCAGCRWSPPHGRHGLSATAAISGRLVVSRLPPQPNTHHSCPPR